MDFARTVTGIIFTAAGLSLIIAAIFAWPAIIYGMPLLIIGILLLINAGNEEKIEGIKQIKRIKNKEI